MHSAEFSIRTEVFEGPLDLLLTLIEKRKFLVNDISLAAVTDDFIKYMNMGEEVLLSERAHFVLTAATLLLIKSKSLLPTLELTEEEILDVFTQKLTTFLGHKYFCYDLF